MTCTLFKSLHGVEVRQQSSPSFSKTEDFTNISMLCYLKIFKPSLLLTVSSFYQFSVPDTITITTHVRASIEGDTYIDT